MEPYGYVVELYIGGELAMVKVRVSRVFFDRTDAENVKKQWDKAHKQLRRHVRIVPLYDHPVTPEGNAPALEGGD